MVQRPLKNVKLHKKPTKYKRVLKKITSESDIITREINKGIVEKYMSLYKKKGKKNSDVR
ncbi:uncharacterized protein Eint_020155 [Encephalitozoon intestinalis ATCC 50506]|uniref:Uncharacterized protein n=1 Tax=Encephalitozoon intestinalis (strain ATCC 50506) TaxID=876142 RepID=W8Q1S9_ENCIT|nr:uncharacterized protein Eint_020155 [Encephalitozoon intestinalis ATCC 50506]AHL30074.1 hypothetical protein Eint_020155 [Encephalitozoon intestinalis ATCC 50506]UTX44664.1 hypothetical protein GPK93_02g01790 [Encephalitozoon intestinalis]